MHENSDILKLLQETEAKTHQLSQRAVVLQSGAIGDCILTLPLVKFLKETLSLGAVDILGHTEYTGILPGRTMVDSVRSMEAVDLHRLFVETKQFSLPDRDPLINFFGQYSWLVTFLGESGSDFEKNLIFTVNCSHSAEVISLPLKPPNDFNGHISDFYIQELVRQSGLMAKAAPFEINSQLIKATNADTQNGREILRQADVVLSKKILVIHPGSGGRNKCWHIDNFITIARQLISKDIEVIFLLGPAEEERFEVGTMAKIIETAKCLNNLSLTEVLGLLSCVSCFMGNDSGITHLASALGTKTIAVFGPSNPTIYRPVGPKTIILRDENSTFTDKPSAKLQQQVLACLENGVKQ